MYIYNELDQQLIEQRAEQFRDQVRRYLAGQIAEDEFRVLRLQNGLYIQRHAPMLRVAINYGLLSSQQLRALAEVSRKYDKSYAHFTTRQNVQFNWPALEQVPDILADLAKVQMHAIQTSGSCIRSVGSDHFAGVFADEIEDPRPWSEIIRQWAALHPEFAYLPRKFKIACTGSRSDRAATQVHDIGVHVVNNDAGEQGFEILVGGGLGRTPMIGKVIRDFLPRQELLAYLEAILRVYNLWGRRDNKYKARIKILVQSLGVEDFRNRVEAEWERIKGGELTLTDAYVDRIKADFQPPAYDANAAADTSYAEKLASERDFAVWIERNTVPHKVAGYRAVTLTLKDYLKAPGDLSDVQMDEVADLADRYNFGEVRTTHEQNMVFAHIKQADLYPLWQALGELGLARPVVGTINDMICCPGLDFCSLANAETLSVARQVQERFDDMDYLYDLGDLSLKMSGCINACAHHHVGHIGILGVDKNGESYYQFTLGGSAAEDASIGKVLGKSIPLAEVGDTLQKILDTYVEIRDEGERFLDTVRRVGNQPFKERVYAANH
ncbi:nitrite/sulfite reductase [Motiliproteus sediminis]|uniref:nitrite/sulfite reductase n=1 Tax=Motiliproteus sediminis TaxID=1468178 RepID=UPI001AEFA75D|nr:nitrite/sulfite reductase [Motiliproteus sediminis]